MKLGKKIVAILMVMLTVAMMFPFSVFAAEDKYSVINDDYTLTSDNQLGTMLTGMMETDDDQYSGYTITDLAVENNKVYVELDSEDNSLLVVAIYEQNTQQMVTSVKKEVDSYVDIAVLDLDNVKLPEYFIAKAFLLEPDTAKARCEGFTCYNYTKEMREFFSKTVDDFNPEEVINLDDDKTNNFVVLKEGARTIEATKNKNVIQTTNENSGTITIINPDSEVSSLKKDDVFHYIYGSGENDFAIICIDKIDKKSDRVIITPKMVEEEELFQFIRIETAVTTATGEYVDPDDFEAYSTEQQNAMLARSFRWDYTPIGIPETTVGPSFSFNLGDENTVLYGELKLKATVTFKFYFTAIVEGFSFKTHKDFKFSFKGDCDVKVGVTGKLAGEKELKRISIPLIAGIKFEGIPKFVYSFSASIYVAFNFSKEIGYAAKTGEKVHKINETNSDFEPNFESEIEIKVGVELEMGLKALGIFKLSLVGGYGIKFTGTPWTFEMSKDVKHLCPLCLKGELKLYGDFGFKGALELHIEVFGKTLYSDEMEIVKLNIADGDILLGQLYGTNITGQMKWHWGECPNFAYRVTFTVTDKELNPISGAKVDSLTTDGNGQASDFFKNDEKYTVTASAKDYQSASKTFTINGIPLQISITLFKEDEEPEEPDTPDPPVVPGKITWSYNSGTKTLSISGSGDMEDYWSYTDAPWHQYYMEAETIKMSEGITRIGDYAFAQFRKVSNVKIPSTVKSIGEGAFYGCERIPEIIIGDKVETIGDYAFYYCATATELEIGKSVKTIGSYAFAQCVALTDVTVPSSVNSIGDYAFAWDKNIVRIAILNPECKIYNSSDVIPSTAIIAGYTGSTAQTHANRYGHTFSKIVLMRRGLNNAGIEKAAAVDYNAKKRNAKCGNTIDGEYYVVLVLNTTLSGSDFTTDQLLYIDQVTADASGKIECTFIPRTSEDCKVYVIGNFSDGSSIKEVSTEIIYDTENCSCNCHKNGIAKFFFKLILFFQKIFRTNKECKCGMPHY